MNRTLTVTWQDPMPLAQAASTMSGLDFLRGVRDGRLPPAPIQQLIGMKLAEIAVHSTLPPGKGYTTLEFKVNLVHGVTMKAGALRATGKLVHGGKSTATAEARLEDAAGALYAHASTTCIILGA